MIEQTLNKSMKQKGPNRWPRLVLRTAAPTQIVEIRINIIA